MIGAAASVMPVLIWLVRLVQSTVRLAINAVVSGALFLLSAFLLVQADEDAEVVGYVVRGIAAIWLWAAAWHYVVRGVLQRPVRRRDSKVKPTGLEALVGTLGCLGSLAAAAATFVFVGPLADWALAGLVGDDPAHPARGALDAGLRTLEQALVDPEPFIGYLIAVPFILVGLRVVSTWAERQAGGQGAPSRSSRRTRTAAGKVPSQETPPAVAAPARSTFDDPVLGRVQWDDRAGRWRVADTGDRIGLLSIETGGASPSERQLSLARNVVQRDFEVLLRASEPARVSAQARGVALPRFTIADAVVEADTGAGPRVRLTLRCDGDADRAYVVQSSDGMRTFATV